VVIKNIQGLSGQQIRDLVAQGGKFVMYKYCISIIVMTFNRPTNVYFIPPQKSGVAPGVGFLFVSLFLGWWGLPWGPIYTIGNIANVLKGGKDVTGEILAQINQNDPEYGVGNTYNIPGQTSNSDNSSNVYNIPTSENNSGNTYNIPR